MTTIDNSQTNLASIGLAAPKQEATDSLGQKDFLKLLTAQLNNQDPMQPQENGEFLAQMAQFSTVDGIQEMQNSFADLAASLQSSQALQASALVGRHVVVKSDMANFDQNGLSGLVSVPQDVGNLSIKIYNEAGELQRSFNQGPKSAGDVSFSWDGVTDSGERAAPGTYRVVAESSTEGETQQFDTYVSANVNSVSIDKGTKGLVLNLAGIGPVQLDDVKHIQA